MTPATYCHLLLECKRTGEPLEMIGPPSFMVSEALPPVPARLVKKILKGDFADMVELLNDNAEVEGRRGKLEGAALHGLAG